MSVNAQVAHACTAAAAADGSLLVLSIAVMKLEMLLAPLNRIHTGSVGQL